MGTPNSPENCDTERYWGFESLTLRQTIMKIHLQSIRHTADNSNHSLKLRFTAIIDDAKVLGTATNVDDTYGAGFFLRFDFDNPEVRKHPKYKAIRAELAELLLYKCEHTSGFHDFTTGVNVGKEF